MDGRSTATRPSRRPSQGLASLVVGVSGVVVLLGAARTLRGSADLAPAAVASTTATAAVPPPLPSGAPARAVVDTSSGDGCSFPDRGFGAYDAWRNLPLGRLLVPTDRGFLDADGGFLLLVHFHGAEPVRKQLVLEDQGLVIAGIDSGTLSSHYARALSGELRFDGLVAAIEREVAAAAGRPKVRARRIALSSWSAGYGAVASILAAPEERVGAVVLLDSLHGGLVAGSPGAVAARSVEAAGLGAFAAAARGAQAGGALFYLTHGAIRPDGYASTAEVASFLLGQLGAAATEVVPNPEDEPLPMVRTYDERRLFVRGYAGDSKEAHCSHLRLLPSITRDHVLPALR